MRKASWFVVLSILTILSSGLLADEAKPKIDFDRGADIEKTIKGFRQQLQFPPLRKYLLKNPAQALKSIEVKPEGKGRIIGVDLIARIGNSEPYNEAYKYPPLVEELPPEVRDPLRADWAEINVIRDELIAEANDLEWEDSQLLQEGIALDQNAEELEQRRKDLLREIDQFENYCTGRELPPDEYQYCVDWHRDLLQRVQQWEIDVDDHNARVQLWRENVLDLRRRAGTADKKGKHPLPPGAHLKRVSVFWEVEHVNLYSNKAEAALRNRCGKLTGVRLDPPTAPYVPVRGRARFDATPQFGPPEDKPCPVVYLWTTENTSGHIGHLEVASNQKSATLVTGENEAKGLVIVEVDEAIGKKRFSAAAPVNVVKGAVQCTIKRHVCTPGGPPFENLCTYDCCGDEVGPATYYSPVCNPNVCGTRFCVPGK